MTRGHRAAPVRAVERPEQAQMLVDREQRGEGVELGRVAESGGALHGAGAGPQQSGAHLQKGGLAGSVGADDGDHLASPHRQVEVGEHGAAAAAHAHAVQPQYDRTERPLRVPPAVAGAVLRDVLREGRGEVAGVQDGGAEQVRRGETRAGGLGAGVGDGAIDLLGDHAPRGQFGAQTAVPGVLGAHAFTSALIAAPSRTAEKAARKARHSSRRPASSVRPAEVSS